jgi:hypothetical protein
MSRRLDGNRLKTRPARFAARHGPNGEGIKWQLYTNGEAQDQRLYIIAGHPEDGDYLCAVRHNEWAACPLHFIWTKNRDKAQVFTEKQLEAIAPHVVAGYSGTKQVRIQ